ncbi:prolyl oligopeptidase family serine peptidase [Hallella sp.]|uniref:carboxylesterase family protein n=1 Tax=Hallella sp. TaxID=2980186 RepID=UPI002A917177|nr:prolyl oligopeptidase family serine peptidase [Hallella sp.]MDY5925823.1 prolyl oligopeptidase family serine peptidase [Hallella sp.]
MVWTSMLAHAFNASKEQITTLGITMGYRKCVITNENSTEAPILVVYLHGGSSKGNDNEKQLLEPGTDSIARYLKTHGINAIFLIPQCPTDKSWGGPMNTMLKAMIDRYASEGVADTNRIYIFGGSMGGTGTWGMLSAYPNFFAAAMPVAANPSKTVVENVATTPAYTVMGTADAIMKVETAASFVEELKALDDDVRMDVEEGWTHETTCIQSYTTARLEWVFSHRRGTPSAILRPTSVSQVVSSQFFSIDGKRLSNPVASKLIIRRDILADGTTKVTKTVAPTSY